MLTALFFICMLASGAIGFHLGAKFKDERCRTDEALQRAHDRLVELENKAGLEKAYIGGL